MPKSNFNSIFNDKNHQNLSENDFIMIKIVQLGQNLTNFKSSFKKLHNRTDANAQRHQQFLKRTKGYQGFGSNNWWLKIPDIPFIRFYLPTYSI